MASGDTQPALWTDLSAKAWTPAPAVAAVAAAAGGVVTITATVPPPDPLQVVAERYAAAIIMQLRAEQQLAALSQRQQNLAAGVTAAQHTVDALRSELARLVRQQPAS